MTITELEAMLAEYPGPSPDGGQAYQSDVSEWFWKYTDILRPVLEAGVKVKREQLGSANAKRAAPAARSCNRHKDCAAADEQAKAAGRPWAEHCHDDCCDECFGS